MAQNNGVRSPRFWFAFFWAASAVALAGALMLVLADLAARLIPTDEELKLGVVTALVGAPLFALIAWRASRSWMTRP